VEMHLRHAVTGDALAISDLVQAGFIQHIAPDWEPSAQEDFLAENQADKLSLKISEAALCLVCEHGPRLLGASSCLAPRLCSCSLSLQVISVTVSAEPCGTLSERTSKSAIRKSRR
jgi:hypothetical protein